MNFKDSIHAFWLGLASKEFAFKTLPAAPAAGSNTIIKSSPVKVIVEAHADSVTISTDKPATMSTAVANVPANAGDAANHPVVPATPPKPATPPVEKEPDISDETVANYLKLRFLPQKDWYSRKAVRNKRFHYLLTSFQVLTTAATPILNLLVIRGGKDVALYAVLSVFASGAVAIITGLIALGKYKDHWINYRQTAEKLESVHVDYQLSLPPYYGRDRNKNFINTVQKILADEQSVWQKDVKSTSPAVASPVQPNRSFFKQPQSSSSDNDSN